LSEEEEKKLSRLEKRLVENVDFDDQALNYLVRTMCGSRTGGWSLPCVMSD
jgi:hypothetical protein